MPPSYHTSIVHNSTTLSAFVVHMEPLSIPRPILCLSSTSGDLVESMDEGEYVATIFLSIPVWIMVFVLRFLLLLACYPLYWLAKARLSMREMLFITFSGLRGCVTLIMAQAVVTETTSSTSSGKKVWGAHVVVDQTVDQTVDHVVINP